MIGLPRSGEEAEPRNIAPLHARRARILRGAQLVAGMALFAAVVIALVHEWRPVRLTVESLSVWTIAASELLVLAGLAASALTWRATTLALGERVEPRSAAKIYFVGQLGKYVPGSVWAFVVQMEMCTRANVARSRSLAASLGAAGFNLLTSAAVMLLALWAVLPLGRWIFVLIPVVLGTLAFVLRPRTLTACVSLFLRVLRRPPLEQPISGSGTAQAAAWSTVSWLAYGSALWLLAVEVGVPPGRAFPLCVGGVALAMSAGFLVVIAPSGIGVREAVLVATLAPVLPHERAFALALVLRLLFTLGDLFVAAITVPVRIRPAARPQE